MAAEVRNAAGGMVHGLVEASITGLQNVMPIPMTDTPTRGKRSITEIRNPGVRNPDGADMGQNPESPADLNNTSPDSIAAERRIVLNYAYCN